MNRNYVKTFLIGLSLTLLLMFAGGISASVWNVNPGDSIQAAIDAAFDGDTVLVAPGIYVENIDFKGKAITVKSTTGPGVTTIDGNNSGTVVTFNSGEGSSSVIEGFTITNGYSINSDSGGSAGGGILCDGSSPVIRNNIITNNYAENTYSGGGWDSGGMAGGGIACDHGARPAIEANVISENYAYNNGGWGHSAGGIAIARWCVVTIEGNTITRNNADQDASGGGLVVTFGSEATINRNVITDNEATNKRTRYSAAGGGLFADKGAIVLITNNLFLRNSAIDTATGGKTGGDAGGAIMVKWELNNFKVINNVIYDNYAESARRYAAGGICQTDWTSTSQLDITNNIIWNNNVGTGATPDLCVFKGIAAGSATYNDISQELFPGTGNIQAIPFFVSLAADDFHLESGSPCIDTGTNVGAPPIDLEGRIRPWDGDVDGIAIVDMGAYEFGAPLPVVPMDYFVVEKAKIDFKKKPDDDKIHVKGRFELDLDNGDDVDISEDVIVTIGPFTETIIMEEKGKKGDKWEYKRPKGETGIKHMKIDWKEKKKKDNHVEFDIHVDKAALGEMSDWDNPVPVSIQIGDDIGQDEILMREKKHHWDYHKKKH